MATAQNTTRANARSMPKGAPERAAPSVLAQATVELNAAVDDLRGVRLVDLEMDIRNLHHLARIVVEWAELQNFYHPDPTADEDTNWERADQTDRLVFAIAEIADRASDLDKAFQRATHREDRPQP
jgi:hypothetical protein